MPVMPESANKEQLKPLLDKMVAGKQLSAIDAKALSLAPGAIHNEEDVLRWLAQEYGLTYTSLEDVDPDRQLLSLFPRAVFC